MANINGTPFDDNNTFNSGAFRPSLDGTNNSDVIRGFAGSDILNGRGGNDTLIGGTGSDTFSGGVSNDRLVWNNGDGSDRMSGNAGADVVEVNGAPVGDDFRLQQDAQGRAIFDRLNLVPFTLTVDGVERFEINGLGGDDILDVNNLTNTGVTEVSFAGRAGNDRLDGSNTATPLVGSGDAGNDTLIGGTANDTLNGGAGDDSIRGGDGIDNLFGNNGNDIIQGDRGNDIMNGGVGNDRLIWNNGDGSDTMSGNAGADVVEVNGAPAGDDFRLQQDAQGRAIFDRLNLVPFTLTVDGVERFEINGLGGNDILDVNNLGNTSVTEVSFAGGAGNDRLDGSGTSTPLVGFGDDGNDTLIGGTANDTLNGGNGNDVLNGGAGNDVLIGGAGNDRFEYNTNRGFTSADLGVDQIELSVGRDKIVLDKTTFATLESLAGGSLIASDFAVVTNDYQAGISTREIVYNSANGNLFYNPNGFGAGFGAGGQFATLVGSPDQLSGSDFFVQA